MWSAQPTLSEKGEVCVRGAGGGGGRHRTKKILDQRLKNPTLQVKPPEEKKVVGLK